LRSWADGFYGARLLSPQAFARCLSLATIYPIVAALLNWVMTGEPEIGGLRLADGAVPAWQRCAVFAVLLSAA
jgi:hypothetical protein